MPSWHCSSHFLEDTILNQNFHPKISTQNFHLNQTPCTYFVKMKHWTSCHIFDRSQSSYNNSSRLGMSGPQTTAFPFILVTLPSPNVIFPPSNSVKLVKSEF